MVVQGLSWPEDQGDWIPLVAGRPLRQSHYEMVADRSLGVPIGHELRLGKDVYRVVGLTSGMVGSGGDGLAFFTVSDAGTIQFDVSGEAMRLERESRAVRLVGHDLGRVQPLLIERARGMASGIPALGPPQVSAVMVSLEPGANAASVIRTISTWPDVSVYTREQQIDLLLSGMVDKAKRQLGLFRVLLVIISTIIMALIIYTLTLDKIHDIAMLKLMGARNGVIVGLILQQALLIGGLGYALRLLSGYFCFSQIPPNGGRGRQGFDDVGPGGFGHLHSPPVSWASSRPCEFNRIRCWHEPFRKHNLRRSLFGTSPKCTARQHRGCRDERISRSIDAR